ncbi:MAG TPA: AzlD domain-containing protein [Candidatus Limnocylindrales bacterium]|nr:AzlD domain-containing protein [Candidatus Limnocylindrales bacterium]HEU4918723.1 AzlD domain-containing protein [Candidatus Limnocylindrales bacterium]
MSTEFIGLAVLMFAATYPSRAVGLLVPGIHRLPRPALDYLQLVGPAVLSAIGAVAVLVRVPEDGAPTFGVGVDSIAVLVALLITTWRRNLLFGIVAAVAIAVIARAVGLG